MFVTGLNVKFACQDTHNSYGMVQFLLAVWSTATTGRSCLNAQCDAHHYLARYHNLVLLTMHLY
jgi:hypothetical protein